MSTPDNVRVSACKFCGSEILRAECSARIGIMPCEAPAWNGSTTVGFDISAPPDSTPSSGVPEPEKGMLLGINPDYRADLRETALSCPPNMPWSLVVELNNLRNVQRAASAYVESQHASDFWRLGETLKVSKTEMSSALISVPRKELEALVADGTGHAMLQSILRWLSQGLNNV